MHPNRVHFLQEFFFCRVDPRIDRPAFPEYWHLGAFKARIAKDHGLTVAAKFAQDDSLRMSKFSPGETFPTGYSLRGAGVFTSLKLHLVVYLQRYFVFAFTIFIYFMEIAPFCGRVHPALWACPRATFENVTQSVSHTKL